MNDEVSVDYELSYGLAAQVDRASGHMDLCHQTATLQLADADFGRILELITGNYAELLPVFHEVLDEGGRRLGLFAEGIEASLASQLQVDQDVANRFGDPGADPSTSATGFSDVHGVDLTCVAVPTELPRVSFGFPFDQVCDLIVWVGYRDPREYVTQWIAGDVGKAYTQGEAWDVLSGAVDAIGGNLGSAANGVPNAWTGQTADRIAARLREWSDVLSEHSGSARTMASYVRDMADQAVAVAQVVVDIISTVVSLLSAALSSAYIPGYGQWKAIKTVKEAWTMIQNAYSVLSVFWDALKMIISSIRMVIQGLTATSLPPAPQAGP